jgi:hypothetical protein
LVNRAAAFTGENGPYWRNAAALRKGNIARSTVRTGSQGLFQGEFLSLSSRGAPFGSLPIRVAALKQAAELSNETIQATLYYSGTLTA